MLLQSYMSENNLCRSWKKKKKKRGGKTLFWKTTAL